MSNHGRALRKNAAAIETHVTHGKLAPIVALTNDLMTIEVPTAPQATIATKAHRAQVEGVCSSIAESSSKRPGMTVGAAGRGRRCGRAAHLETPAVRAGATSTTRIRDSERASISVVASQAAKGAYETKDRELPKPKHASPTQVGGKGARESCLGGADGEGT